jgi:uncharacterized Zn finger protein
MALRLHHLAFDQSEGDEGVTTLEAMAATTSPARRDALLQEAQQVLDWAWRRFPDSHGLVEEGMDWDHDLQLHEQAGGWHELVLTFTGSAAFVAAFEAEVLAAPDL